MQLSRKLALKDAHMDWVLSTIWHRPMAITLTMKQAIELQPGDWEYINRGIARAAVIYFLNELDRRCYPKINGKRSGKTKRFVVLEGGEGIRWHYHLLIDCPAHVDPRVFASWIYEIWNKMIWGYRQIDIQSADLGWAEYILKLESKVDYSDCVELDACHGLGDKLL